MISLNGYITGGVQIVHRRHTIFVNMDETAVYTEILPRTTIDTIGVINVAASVRVGTSDRVTAALTVSSNGEKLRPLIIFKGSEGGRIARTFQSRNSPYPIEAIYAVQANAWMNEQIMIKWLDHILSHIQRQRHRKAEMLYSFWTL